MNAEELFIDSLSLIERIAASAARRQRLPDADLDDFASIVKLKFIENDYEVLKKFQGRSSLSTYLTAVIHRVLLDYRIHEWGKWHASAEAKRLGSLAVDLERLLHRDGRSLEEALPILTKSDPSLTPELAEDLVRRLPSRPPKRRMVALEDAAAVTAPDHELVTFDREEVSSRLSATVTTFIDGLPSDERLPFRLRFENGMTVAQIARSMKLDQKLLYRTIDRQLRALRALLEDEGVSTEEVAGLIADRSVVLDFGFRNERSRPSIDQADGARPKEISR
ncbi:MAG TPA: sigma-70 family RNA polymerase sigma factor [Thermoanaerobaculia bacterium]